MREKKIISIQISQGLSFPPKKGANEGQNHTAWRATADAVNIHRPKAHATQCGSTVQREQERTRN